MKKWAKFLCCFALLGAFLVGGLAGCATVSNIKNNYAELIYNGNAAALVEANEGKFLYFSNAYATAPTSEEEYSSAKQYSYLARVNSSNLQAKNEYFSPKNVENVSQEVTGYEDGFMFVLGQNIYYATPNRQMVTIKNSNGEADTSYHFEFTCFYKSSLNGDHKKKLFTTTGEISKIEVLKSGNTYYIVMLAGNELVAINLSNDKAQTLATGVTSVALPKTFRKDIGGSTLDWDGQIYFSTTRDNGGNSGATINLVKKIAVSSTNQDDAEEVYNQGSVEFIAREENVVFFVGKDGNDKKIYMLDLGEKSFYDVWTTVFEGASVDKNSVEGINAVKMKVSDGYVLQGYVFKAGDEFKYITKSGKSDTLSLGDGMSDAKILFVSGMTAFLASGEGIYRADLSSAFLAGQTNIQCQTIVEMSGIQSDAAFAFDGGYVYFYSTLQEVPEDLKDEDEEETEETDSNLYLHRARVTKTNEFELLGRTVIKSRRTK